MQNCYDFPVGLYDAYTESGLLAPKVKVVVREDTRQPLATVSHKYQLITHNEVLGEARRFIEALGQPEERYGLSRNGAVMWGSFVYKDHTIEPVVGEPIGLRVYVENSYNSSKSVSIDVGGLVLSCLNGMTSFTRRNRYTWKHTKNTKISMPSPDSILAGFRDEAGVIAVLGETRIDEEDANFINKKFENVFSEKSKEVLADKILPGIRAWDGLQAATYEATHSGEIGFVSRMRKLQTISKVFSERFLSV